MSWSPFPYFRNSISSSRLKILQLPSVCQLLELQFLKLALETWYSIFPYWGLCEDGGLYRSRQWASGIFPWLLGSKRDEFYLWNVFWNYKCQEIPNLGFIAFNSPKLSKVLDRPLSLLPACRLAYLCKWALTSNGLLWVSRLYVKKVRHSCSNLHSRLKLILLVMRTSNEILFWKGVLSFLPDLVEKDGIEGTQAWSHPWVGGKVWDHFGVKVG